MVTMRQLLECGVHFGHQTKRWNPKMKEYIFTSRNGIHVIDLQQSIVLIKEAYDFVQDIVRSGGSILFVGTKKQAQESIQTEAERCDMPYVQHRWLGGTLTNIATIRQSINKLKDYQKAIDDGSFNRLSGKEASRKTKAFNRLSFYLNGIKNMIQTPSALFVVDTKKEQMAIKEANKLNIPIIGVVDTNADPNEVQYPIPANDDAIRAIKLITSIISSAVLSVKDEATLVTEEEMKKGQDQVTASPNKAQAKKVTEKEASSKKDEKSDTETHKKSSSPADKTPEKVKT